jgi:TP901 family phage tail tape measure protein
VPERNRTTKVTLLAQVSGYIAGMDAAARKTAEFADGSAAKLAAQRAAFEGLGRAALAAGAVVAAGVILAIAKFAEFDQAISNVKAVTQETAENMQLLRDAALDAGAKTVFTATEAAHAIEELGKNGLSTKDILAGGLNGALALASSGQLSVARAAEIASISMKQFGLEGNKIPHIADLLAAGAGKAAGDVEDLAQALAQSGLVANQTGLSIEETTGILAAFADAGLIGSDAGTSLKTALQRLTPISKESDAEMKRLGISAYDAQGAFIGAAAFAGNLQDSLKDLSAEQRNAALAQIFGSDAVRAAAVLYEQGAAGIQKYIDQTNDSGYAARQAAERLNNLRGDLEQLGGSIDTVLIKQGSAANDILRAFVQSGQFLVDSFGALPEPILNAGLAVGAIAAAVLLAGGIALLAIPKFAALKAQLTLLEISGGAVAGAIGKVGGALGIATVLIGAFVSEQAAAKSRVDAFRDSLDKTTGAATDYTRELVIKQLEEQKAFDSARKAGITQSELTDAVLAGGKALDLVQQKLSAASSGQEGLNNLWDGASFAIIQTSGDLDRLRASLDESQDSWYDSLHATKENTTSLEDMSGAARDANQDISELADAIRGFGSAQLDVNSATRDFEAAVDDLTQSIIDNGASLDVGEEAGRNNLAAIDDLAKSTLELAAATVTQTGRQEDANTAIADGRQRLIEALAQFGITGDAAEAYADRLGLIPANISTAAQLTGLAEAQGALDTFIRTNDGRTISVNIGYRPPAGSPNTYNENGGWYNQGVRAFENGGFPSGIYPGRPGGIHKFAEQKLPWETYISPKPGHERENIGYALESLARLGFRMPSSDNSSSGDQVRAIVDAVSKLLRPGSEPTVIDPKSVEAIGRVVARSSRQLDRTGGPTSD